MDLELSGKVAVVTGASKGIGLSVVQALLAEGALVVAGARTTPALQGLANVTAVAVDLHSFSLMRALSTTAPPKPP